MNHAVIYRMFEYIAEHNNDIASFQAGDKEFQNNESGSTVYPRLLLADDITAAYTQLNGTPTLRKTYTLKFYVLSQYDKQDRWQSEFQQLGKCQDIADQILKSIAATASVLGTNAAPQKSETITQKWQDDVVGICITLNMTSAYQVCEGNWDTGYNLATVASSPTNLFIPATQPQP